MATKRQHNFNFEKICRTCLQVKKDMKPLFEQLTATMLMEVTKVQVAIGDGLPGQLCLQCVHQISRCHTFKETVERNDVALREQAKRVAEEALKATMEALPKDEQDPLMLGTDHQYLPFIEPTSSTQIIEGFFGPEQPQVSQVSTDVTKQEFGQTAVQQVEYNLTNLDKKQDGLDSDEEQYLEMVVMQASSTVNAGRHVCNLCHKEFKHAKWLKQHMRSHSNWIKANCKKPPMCNICERTFKGPGMLKMHMRTHEQRPPKQPTCSVCQRVFPTKTLLYRHRQTHFEQKTHQCSICEKKFYSGYALRSHMARHRGERPYVCSMCSKSFYNPTDLKVHFRLHTGEKPLKCSECNKTFRRHSTLCQHMKKHKGIRNHVCQICNKGFYEVSKLNAHIRVHTGERPFECQFCERKFAQQSALIYHRRTHTGEKPFNCKICSAKFTTSSARNNHMITHTGNKRFVCPVCLKGCTSRTELRVHSAKHTGEKLFGCEICGQRFCSPSYLAIHRRHHTGEKKYQCNVCGKAYIECTSYKRHMKTHENKQGEGESGQDRKSEKEQVPKEESSGDEQKESIDDVTEVEVSTGGSPVAAPKRYQCGICVKGYKTLTSLKKHLVTHMQVQQPQPSPQQSQSQQQQHTPQQQQQQQQQQQHQQQQQQQQQPQPTHQQACLPPGQMVQMSPIQYASVQGQYPVISTVQSLQLQQTQQQINTPQQLQVQTIQLHPQHQPIQIHAVGVQQVQQQQLHVATSSCQSVLPNILQLQPAGVGVSGLGQQELGGVAHRIILQPPHPAVYTIHQHH